MSDRMQGTTGSGGKFSEHDASVVCSRSEKFSGPDFVDSLPRSDMSAWIEPSESPELVRVTLAWSNRGGGYPCGRTNKFRRVLRRVPNSFGLSLRFPSNLVEFGPLQHYYYIGKRVCLASELGPSMLGDSLIVP